MKVLFATTNPAKIKKYVDKLKEKDIEILTIKDLGINLKPEETGKNAIENAYIKAKTYYDKTKIISIGMDNNLYIEGYPLDSISIMPECNKYFVDLTEEDKNKNQKDYNEDEVIEFIVRSVRRESK